MGEADLDQYRGVDFAIRDDRTRRFYAVQVKIGSRIRGVHDIRTFLRTTEVFRQFIGRTVFAGYQVVPVWYTAAGVDDEAHRVLRSAGACVFAESKWDMDPNKCRLFINFASVLKTGELYYDAEDDSTMVGQLWHA